MTLLSDEERAGLAPCPFCGARASMYRDGSIFAGQTYPKYPGQTWGVRIECDGLCHAMTCWWHTQDEAIEAWNCRPALTATLPIIERAIIERCALAAECNMPRNEPGEYAAGRFAAADAIRALADEVAGR